MQRLDNEWKWGKSQVEEKNGLLLKETIKNCDFWFWKLRFGRKR